ncbi:hypothetical protein DF185_07785 [Marinifilum breve]|uniref:Outer membrane protein beta-barrel domain-containing protein n=1 Tax=Marinifilum breve TaxID=2184082 RepID=A0A2V4A0K7_9BACT|nr:hypothetical protein [Marinifilum breve]PXY01377.1 hypothetical protein DF185_07785 [Marinifilum breve]
MKDNWDNNWSDYIKSTLDEYNPPVPDQLWNNLEGKIPVSNPSVFLTGKFFAGAILSIGMIVGAYFLFSNKNQLENRELSEQLNNNNKIEINKTVDLHSANNNYNLHITDTDTDTDTDTEAQKSTREISTSIELLNDLGESGAPAFKEKPSNEERKHAAIADQQYLYAGIIKAEEPLVLHESFHKRIKIQNKKKKRIEKDFNMAIDAGMQYMKSASFIAGIQAKYNWNRLGVYGGLHYSPNQLREFTSGEGAESSTVKVLTADGIQHRINFFSGLSYHVIKTRNNRLSAKAGVISKTISLNGDANYYNPLMISTGLELRIPVLRKYNTGIYYNYLFKPSDQKINGHQLGVRIQLNRKR